MERKSSFVTIQVVMLVALTFLLGTSEFIVVGILPEISEGKFDRFRFTMVCVLIFVAANLLCGLTSLYPVFAAARIVIAVVSGTLVAVSMTYAGDVAAPENMPKVVAGIFSGFSIASVFGVPIATAVTRFLSWRAAFFWVLRPHILSTHISRRSLRRNFIFPEI